MNNTRSLRCACPRIERICKALYIFQLPKTPVAWKEISKTFEIDCNLPHCVGVLDGKHFCCRHQYIPEVISTTTNPTLVFGRGMPRMVIRWRLFKNCKLYNMLSEDMLGLPLPEQLPRREMKIPYFFGADSEFPLCKNIMKPYPGDHASGSFKRIFNYQLSRTRRVVENTFSILSVVFRVLRKPMLLEFPKAELIVMAIILLHNYLRNHSPTLYMPHGSLDHEENNVLNEGSLRSEVNTASMIPLRNIPRRTPAVYHKIKDEVADYFMKEGAILWQNPYA
ncbi:hypothetical protein PR048_004664 [Dryococelus australis]|uniref:DDE Tnp4 domain-containing protein n=1 Tax=Dryococelus australis TaxID=614101 RepID=A0ABQ9I6U7_9NEOP|nr:hypothetical protein PR048_004664 [Dryococelus australis]